MSLLISILIVCLIVGVIYWALSVLPLPPPVRMVVQVVLAIIVVIWLISLLSGGLPTGPLFPHARC